MIDYINWWEENKEVGLEDVKKIYLGLFDKVEFLFLIYYLLLYKYFKNF